MKLQCKHIPELPVLQFLAGLRWTAADLDFPLYNGVRDPLLGTERGGTWFTHGDGGLFPSSVQHAMPADVPEKLALAKMRRLIERGLVDGCPCGCRGDFRLSGKGREYLAQHATPPEAAP